MKTLLSNGWERLRSTYWLVPTLLALGAIALSALTLHIDTGIKPKWAQSSAWVWAGGAEGARSMLATIASSTITVAGVVFSMTVVTLTLASSQFGPRLLRNFMADRGTQLVLGVFVATFLYCILVLRAIRGTDELTVVPYLSVTFGVAFAVASVGFLIYFIHHISTSIIAENVIARVAVDLQSNIDRLYPKLLSAGSVEPVSNGISSLQLGESLPIVSARSGFLQAVATDNLLELAIEYDVTLRVLRRPGEFVAQGSVLAEVAPGSKNSEALSTSFQKHLFFGDDRTPTQDIEFSIDQLVEVAVRALSPGINDPFTAITCIEWLGVALMRLAGREIPKPERYDDHGKLRIVSGTTDFEGLAGAALNQVRQYGSSSVAVTLRLLNVLGRTGPHLVREGDRRILHQHARATRDDGVAAARSQCDRDAIEQAFGTTARQLLGVGLASIASAD